MEVRIERKMTIRERKKGILLKEKEDNLIQIFHTAFSFSMLLIVRFLTAL